jgi:hypothetical protein
VEVESEVNWDDLWEHDYPGVGPRALESVNVKSLLVSVEQELFLRAWSGQDVTYLMWNRERDEYKIGHTAQIATRLATLNRECRTKLMLCGVRLPPPGRTAYDEEQRLHSLFADLRVHGEWFTADPKILAGFGL